MSRDSAEGSGTVANESASQRPLPSQIDVGFMWVDVGAGIFVLIFAILGYSRGLFSQAWSVASLVGSYFAADPALAFVQERVGLGRDDSLLGEWILKLVVGLAVYILLLMLGYGLEKLLVERFKLISAGNRLLGSALGIVKGGVAVLVSVWVLQFFMVGAHSGAADLQAQLDGSRFASRIAPYNPCNLLLLARVRPYLPQEVTGAPKPPVSPPASVGKSTTFKALLSDNAFLMAYKDRRFVDIIQNERFHAFAADGTLLQALEKVQ